MLSDVVGRTESGSASTQSVFQSIHWTSCFEILT
jgi:hypothetical protein